MNTILKYQHSFNENGMTNRVYKGFGITICVPEELAMKEFSNEYFYNSPKVLRTLKESGIVNFDCLPNNVGSFLLGLKSIGATVGKKFMQGAQQWVNSFDEEIKQGKLVNILGRELLITKEMYDININQIKFPCCSNVCDYLSNAGIYKLKDLSYDVDFNGAVSYIEQNLFLERIIELHLKSKLNRGLYEFYQFALDLKNSELKHLSEKFYIKERDLEIFRQRLVINKNNKNTSLEKVAKNFNITRERVRQIADNVFEKIILPYKQVIQDLKADIAKNNGVVPVSFVLPYMPIGIKSIVEYLFNNENIYFILNSQVICETTKSTNKFINSINNYFEIYINKKVNSEKLEALIINFLKTNNYSMSLLRSIRSSVFQEHEPEMFNYIKILGKADMISSVFKKYFTSGLNINKDFSILNNKLKENYPGFFENDCKQTIVSLIVRRDSEIYIWGNYYYIHKDNIYATKEDLLSVSDWIKTRMRNSNHILAKAPYMEFKKQLNEIGIVSEEALYTCLRIYFNEDFFLPRIPKIFKKNITKALNYEQIMCYHIEKMGKEFTFKLLKQDLINNYGWKYSTILTAFKNCRKKS